MSQQITGNTFILKHTHAHTCTNKVFDNEKVLYLMHNFLISFGIGFFRDSTLTRQMVLLINDIANWLSSYVI